VAKKVAARSVPRKVDRDTERRREIAEEFGLLDEVVPTDVAGEARHQRKKESDRDRETYVRRGRRPRVAGFEKRVVKTGGAMMVPKNLPPMPDPADDARWVDATPEDARMLDELRRLLDAAAQPFEPDEIAWPSEAMEKKYRRHRGKRKAEALEAIRRAYLAVWPLPNLEWETSLRDAVRYALSYRLAKGVVPKHVPRNGVAILAFLARGCVVPAQLKAADIERVLSTSTLSRGRGAARNVDRALDDLIKRVNAALGV
jgi:hypothetical protein